MNVISLVFSLILCFNFIVYNRVLNNSVNEVISISHIFYRGWTTYLEVVYAIMEILKVQIV